MCSTLRVLSDWKIVLYMLGTPCHYKTLTRLYAAPENFKWIRTHTKSANYSKDYVLGFSALNTNT